MMNQDSYLPYSQNPRSQVGAAAGFQNQNYLNKMDYKKNGYNNNMYNIQMNTNQATDFGFGAATGNGVRNNTNNNNPRKGNSLWECNICHKIFKERKGFYQHINSNTHEPIKYSCSQCGKGFASLGALALHNEQASHAHLPNRGIIATGDSAVSPVTEASATFPPGKSEPQSAAHSLISDNHSFYPVASGNGNQFFPPSQQQFTAPFAANKNNNVNGSGAKNQGLFENDVLSAESYYGTRNDIQGIKQQQQQKLSLSSKFPHNQQSSMSQQNQQQEQQQFKGGAKPLMSTCLSSQEPMEDNDNRFSMYFTGMIDLGSLLGAFSWCIGDEMNGVMVTQGAITVVDTFLSTEQLEYKGLINGLKAALSKGLKAVTIRSNSEMVISHVMGEQKSKYLETVYRSLDELKAEALAIFPLFELIKFELVPIERNKYVYQIAKKNIMETMSLNNNNNSNNNSIQNNDNVYMKGAVAGGEGGTGLMSTGYVPPLRLHSSSISSHSPPMPQYNHFSKNSLGNRNNLSSNDSMNINDNNSLVSTPCHSNPNSFPSRYSVSSGTTMETNNSNFLSSGFELDGCNSTGNNTMRSNTSGNMDYSNNHYGNPPGLNNRMFNNTSNMMNNISNMLLSSSHHDSDITHSDQHSGYNQQQQQQQQQLKDQREEHSLAFSAHASLMDEMNF